MDSVNPEIGEPATPATGALAFAEQPGRLRVTTA